MLKAAHHFPFILSVRSLQKRYIVRHTTCTVNHMKTVKTTINIDEETWNEFKKTVSSRYGSIRKLSSAVEEAIQSFNTAELLNRFSGLMGIDTSTYPSVREIKEKRPRLEVSAGETVRAMRDEREARLSRY